MVKDKSMIEKVWWVIPPAVIALFTPSITPLVITVWECIRNPSFSFFSIYGLYIGSFLFFLSSFWGVILMLLTITFMGIGYYLSRKRSVAIRIVVPIITAIVGHYISLILYIWYAYV